MEGRQPLRPLGQRRDHGRRGARAILAAMKVRSLLQNGVLALFTCVACALAIEGAARISEAMRVRRAARALQEEGPLDRYSPLLGWEKNPGSERLIVRPEFTIHLKINAHGLRGPDRDYQKPAGVRRVLLLGDSFTAGYYAEEEQTLRAVLEAELNARCSSRWEVINGGTGAYSTDQELLFYTSEGVRYDPDVVVLLFYYNDLAYNVSPRAVSGEHKPYFELREGRLVLEGTPTPRPKKGQHNRQNPAVARLAPWHGSIALRMLSRRTSNSNPRLHAFLSRLGLVPPISTHPPGEMCVYGAGVEAQRMWGVTRAILAQLNEDVQRRHARLLVFYVPARFEVNDSVWQLTRERYGLDPDQGWNRQRVITMLSYVCHLLDIPLVDPRSALEEAERQGPPAYYTRDVHWTAVGNRVAAEVLGPEIREIACAGAMR